jgi:hypothetical protein
MRGPNEYQPLQETHDQVAAELEQPPQATPEAVVQDQQREAVAEPPAPVPDEIGRSIDAAEERRAALDRELADMRAAGRGPEQEIAREEPGMDRQSDIDRALALQPNDGPAPEQLPEPDSLENHVAPEEWTSRGGMVEQQASANEWFEHSNEVLRERGAEREFADAGNELTSEDRELLEAARETEAQVHQQELGQSQFHEPSGP